MLLKSIELKMNPGSIKRSDIPVMDYPDFQETVGEFLSSSSNHCVAYYSVPDGDSLQFICCIACDEMHVVKIFSHRQSKSITSLDSIAEHHPQMCKFEREIHELQGIDFPGNPWLKPVRFPVDRIRPEQGMDQYPFYSIEGDELHEVGVGPIHAGIIEPGYFRFICNGEKVLHLEIQLGYQHRGVESLFSGTQEALKQMILAESICGDTTIGHALCHAGLTEALGNQTISQSLFLERTVALELERIAVHIGDSAALCTDVAYQFGQVVNEALRTLVINTLQSWCGNRFGKGLIRPAGSFYPLTPDIRRMIIDNLNEVLERYLQITEKIFRLPSVLSRFEGTGRLTLQQVSSIGAIGMAARSSGLKRDLRWSHPFAGDDYLGSNMVLLHEGDVWARAILRKTEVEKSIQLIKQLLNQHPETAQQLPDYHLSLEPSSFAISLVEGWRGEICHTAVTDNTGRIVHYKVKDPSFNNWMALALSVRNQGISDFPLCNKSFNLSYCGNDL
jgi:Ni,Fe-hydrogenase III large subunit